MNHGKMNRLGILALALVFAIGLSSCGRKGPLEAPDGSVVDSGSDSTQDDYGRTKRKNGKPDNPFILDALL